MSNSNADFADDEEEGNRMDQTSPFPPNLPPPLVPTAPPPIPPKPKKFNRYAKWHTVDGTTSRPPMVSPPPTPATDNNPTPLGHVHKRKLTLNMPIALSSSSPSTSSMSADNEAEGLAAAICKSPKLMTPGQSRMWAPVICTICMDDLFSYPEVDPKTFAFSMNESGNFSQAIPRPDNIRPTVSTRCGHLFHTECINKWFMENKEKELKECPFCKREMMANDTTRIFPIFEDL